MIMHLSIVSPRGGSAGIPWGLDSKASHQWKLDRTPKNRVGKLDTFSGSSKLDFITNLMAQSRDFGYHIFAYGWPGELERKFSKLSNSPWVSRRPLWGNTLIGA